MVLSSHLIYFFYAKGVVAVGTACGGDCSRRRFYQNICRHLEALHDPWWWRSHNFVPSTAGLGLLYSEGRRKDQRFAQCFNRGESEFRAFMACHEYEYQLAGPFRQATKPSIPRNSVFVPSEPSPCESSSVLSSANFGPHLTPNAYENEHTNNLWTAIFRKVLKFNPMSHRQHDLKGILDFVSIEQKSQV